MGNIKKMAKGQIVKLINFIIKGQFIKLLNFIIKLPFLTESLHLFPISNFISPSNYIRILAFKKNSANPVLWPVFLLIGVPQPKFPF